MSEMRAALVATCLLALGSCGRWTVPASLVGTWSGTPRLSVRVRQERGPDRLVVPGSHCSTP